MSRFTPNEKTYLGEQRLGRLATVDAEGQPHVVPVGFRFDPTSETIGIGGRGFARSKKLRDARANPRVAFVVDDLVSTGPFRPRGVEVRGVVEIVEGDPSVAPGFDDVWLRLTPRRIASWGLDTDPFTRHSRAVG
jgi:pyridoxamine 5'-phosphate oxidase family protein